ncbi:MAG: DUF4476 domain-containing protein [Burkholderiales bacterium]|nr:DUF4476 domain-containing protein [Flavobacterium sp.]
MKRKITLNLFFLFMTMTSFAQYAPVGHLTVFSESGDKFFLVLNGEQQNDVAQTNIRVEDLNQPYYSAKIIFSDNTILEISKNYLPVTDGDGVYKDVTYKLKSDKNNRSKKKLTFFSMIPVEQGFIAPSNVYVVHYGQPERNVGYTQTSTTTTVGTGVNANVNVGGISMNVNINDPYGTSVTQTTTTHTTTDNHSQHIEEAPRGCVSRYAMGSNDFSSALSTVKNQGFDDTRLKTAKQIASANCLNTNQITQICQSFGFEETKLDFAKFAYDFCVEPKNYFKLNNIFGFSSNVDDLTDYVRSRN